MTRTTYKTRSRNSDIGRLILVLVVSLLPIHISQAAEPATRPAKPSTAPADEPFPAMRKWFADLANPDDEIRDQAITALMGLRSDDLPAFRKMVQENQPLAPGQLLVIRQIVTHVYLAGQAYDAARAEGFLGIKPPIHSDGQDAVVYERVPGFIAERMFRDGDIILGVMERPETEIKTFSDLQTALGRIPAGTRLHFQIMRHGRIIQVPIILDPRPVEADKNSPTYNPDAFLDFDIQRRARANTYWQKNFADLVDDAA